MKITVAKSIILPSGLMHRNTATVDFDDTFGLRPGFPQEDGETAESKLAGERITTLLTALDEPRPAFGIEPSVDDQIKREKIRDGALSMQ